VRAADKADARPIVLGSGEHRYAVTHDWGELPAGHAYGNTHGVCEDARGFIYIKHTVGAGAQRQDAIVVFDPKGRFVRSWGPEFKGGAHGLHLQREGGEEFLYLCDPARHLVVKTTLEGQAVVKFPFPGQAGLYAKESEYRPTNVAIAPDGTVFVADGYGKNFIHRYTTAGKYLASFAGTGSEPGQTKCPHGLMVDTRGAQPELVVADRSNRRLQYFSLAGEHLRFVKDELRAPCHFHEHKGVLLIPDLESRVTLFDRSNKLITHLGDGGHFNGIRDKSRDQFTPGKFVAPHSACFDHEGNLFVVEWVEVGRVTKLTRLG
jgi:sugar lactone lactonase YvrE